jgi:hypothetical protein
MLLRNRSRLGKKRRLEHVGQGGMRVRGTFGRDLDQIRLRGLRRRHRGRVGGVKDVKDGLRSDASPIQEKLCLPEGMIWM